MLCLKFPLSGTNSDQSQMPSLYRKDAAMKDQKLRPITDEDRVTAIFFGETRNQQEVLELSEYAGRFSRHGEIRNISMGPITAYVVSMMADARHLLIGLDYTLRKGYVFGCVQIPYLEATYRFVMSLAAELNSQLSPLPACCMCGRPVPFPPEVMTTSEDGNRTSATRLLLHRASLSSRKSKT